jgi:hypothetical protein
MMSAPRQAKADNKEHSSAAATVPVPQLPANAVASAASRPTRGDRKPRPPRFSSTVSDSDASATDDDDFAGPLAAGDKRRNIVYRCLRLDEVTTLPNGRLRLACHRGIVTRPDGIPKLPGAHIQAGEQAKVKSTWLSTTRSLRAAAAWAIGSSCVVAKLEIPPELRQATVVVDNPRSEAKAFVAAFPAASKQPLKAIFPAVLDVNNVDETVPVARFITASDPEGKPLPALVGCGPFGVNAAKSSREVLIGSTAPGAVVVPEAYVHGVGRVSRRVPDEVSRQAGPLPGHAFVSARAKAKDNAASCDVDWTAWEDYEVAQLERGLRHMTTSDPKQERDAA